MLDEDPERLFRTTHTLPLGGNLSPWAAGGPAAQSVGTLMRILRAAGREVACAGHEAAASGPLLLRRLDELSLDLSKGLRLECHVGKRTRDAIAEIISAARRRASRGLGIRGERGSVLSSPPAFLPDLLGVLRSELKKMREGSAWNSRLRLDVDSQGHPELRLHGRRPLRFPGHVVVLDGTGNVARLEAAMPIRTVREVRIDVEMPDFKTVHVIRNANRKVAASPERRARLLADLQQAAKAFIRPGRGCWWSAPAAPTTQRGRSGSLRRCGVWECLPTSATAITRR